MRAAEPLFDQLMAHRWVALFALIAITAGLGAGIARFRFDNSYRMWFVDDDPALVAYDEFLELFGSDETVIVAVETDGDPLSADTLQVVRSLSDRLLELDEVERVWSLTHAEAMTNVGGGLQIGRFIEEVPPPEDQLPRLRAELEHGPLTSRLVSRDSSLTAILLMLEPTGESFEPKMRLVDGVRRVTGEASGDRRVLLAGSAVIDEAFFRYSERDTATYAPVMALVLILMLGLMFRSVAGVVLPLTVCGVSIVWAVGFLLWMGWVTNIVSTMLPPMLVAVGVADSVHLLQQLRLRGRLGEPPDVALRNAWIKVLRPCLLTTLTTAAGMAALSAAHLSGIREFGLAAAVGVLGAFVVTMVGLPLALSVMPQRLLGGLQGARGRPVPTVLVRAAMFATRRNKAVVAGAVVAVGLAIAGIARLEVGSSMVSYFWDDDPVFVDGRAIDAHFGGALPGEVLVQAIDGDLLEPEALEAMEACAAYMEAQEATGAALSPADLLREARRVLRGDPPGTSELPSTRAEAAQVLMLVEGDAEVDRFLTVDRTAARIEVPLEMARYEVLVDRLEELEAGLEQAAGGRVEARVTGLARLMGAMEKYLVDSQIRTFSLAFVLVLGCIAVFFRSWRAGLLSAVPNLFPLVLVLGLMGWTGIKLDLTTIMVAPLLLGLVVDDTVHVLERVLDARSEGATVPDAFGASVQEVGHAVLITSVILTAGFLCPVLGSFKPNFFFGVLTCTAIVLALVGDLLVFPAVGTLLPRLVDRR